ncbi:MAG TPA: HAD family phosphatase [Atopostipes sp.]|jgi:HAD superfamily hydrolase (TIGR01509 family)|nr:HAD family phosphatase [Atopostipes sp.]
MSRVKTVIFDMDGLMFDTEKIYYKTSQATADKLGMDYSFDVYSQFIGAGDDIMIKTMHEMYDDHALLGEFLENSEKELDYQLRNGTVDLHEGLIELLDYLKQEGIPAVVASSTHREMVEHLLERSKVRHYFKDVVGGDEVPTAKPDPAIFNKAFTKTGIENKEEAIVLEDSKNGVLAAFGAGIPVIHIPDMITLDEETAEKTAAILPDLHHVIDFIEEQNK